MAMEKVVSDEALRQTFTSMKQTFATPQDVKNIIIEDSQGVTLLKRNTAYKVGDFVHTDKLAGGLFLECIQAGTTGAKAPTI